MQKIEKNIKRILVFLILIVTFGTLLMEYAFNITFFRQIILLPFAIITILVLSFFYFKPETIIKRRKEILLLIISLLIFFILMESALRLTDCGWKWNVTPEEIVKYKYESSTKICNSIVDGKKFYRTTNREGFVDDDFMFNESDYNIFLVGDSFAACLESDYQNCVHQKLERDLRKDYGENINVMNFGVSSYSGLAELAVIKKYVPEYKPKMIILYFFVNDFQENRDYSNKIYETTKLRKVVREITPKTFLFFFTHGKNILDTAMIDFKWYRKISGLEEQTIKGHAMYENEYNKEWTSLIQEELKVLDETYQIARDNNITLLHVAVTAPEQIYEDKWLDAFNTYPSLKLENYNSSKPNSIIMNHAGEKNIPHLDLLPLFRRNSERLHWKEGHWNDEGQIFAGEKIREHIIENNLIINF